MSSNAASATAMSKADLIKKYQTKKDDTGSPEVQVAVPGEKNRIIFQSADPGMLGRAAALHNR